MALPLAYFLSWLCYGQRLHGDERGTVDREHNKRGTPLLPADPARQARAAALMAGPAVTLSQTARNISERAIVGLCAERDWHLLAISIRSTHGHVVVNCGGRSSPERALAQIKARATRELRDAGLFAADAKLWTEHGSTRWINNFPGLAGAIAYVNDWQDGPNRDVLEEKRDLVRARTEALREWLRARGLPEDGCTVVWGESDEERKHRVWSGDEPGTK